NAIAAGNASGASGLDAAAFGYISKATGDFSTAMGADANATATSTTAIGQNAFATAVQATAVGVNANASGASALALGANAAAGNAGDVALGSGSVTDVAVGTTSTTINGTAYNFAGTTPTSTVSVGAVGTERTITNVAAGRISGSSTDAINGSQLFATNQAVDAIGTTVNNINTGGGIKYFHANSTAADSSATGADSVAIGPLSTATGANAIAAGNASGASGLDSAAFGYIAKATGDFSTAMGADANATATSTTAIGQNAFATAVQATALGVNANASGASALALGANAAAGNAGDVALGSGSVTAVAVGTPNAVINGTTYAFQGTTPASTVSVGAVGAERTITNVAAGRISGSSTDAINGSQLFATNQAVDSLGTQVTTIGGQVTQNTTDISNLGNTINNIAGDTSATYTDANGDGIRYVRTNDRTLAVSDSSAQGIGSTAVGYNATAVADSSLALGRESQATIDGGVALGSGSISNRALAPATGQIAAGPSNFIEYNTTDKTLLGAVSVGSDTSYRQITNVADGTSSQDAVTVRQLQGAIASVAASPSKYFHANSAAGDSLAVGAESVAVGPTTVVNGDNGIGIGNGAIVDQVAPGGTAIGQNAHVMLADGVALGTNSTAAGIQSVALGAGAQSNNINSVALGAQSITSVGAQTNYTAFALASPQTSVGEVSIGSAGSERKLTNLAAGSADTDAVNVSQLKSLGTNVTNLIGGNTTVNPDGSITGPTYNIQGNNYSTVYDAFGAVDNTLTSITNGGGIKYFRANSTLADSVASGTDSVSIGPESVASGTDSLAAGHGAAATGAGGVALGQGAQANNANDVALGSGSTTQAAVGTSSTTIQGKTYDFAGTAPVGTVSVGAQGAERTITNVAAGRISADSTDAINGSQLNATNSAINDLQTGVGTITKNAVTYDLNPDGSKKNSITLQGGDVNAPVVISNVGKGVAPTDAVNVAQLGDSITQANSYTDTAVANGLTSANNYTDQKFGQLNREIGDVRSEARQAAAIGLAAASLRYDDRPGKLSVAVGGGLWRGEGALAFGAGYTSENGRVRGNLSGTAAGGQVGVGAGLSFTLN
ncbi:YadA-like family protein, partial [Rhizobium sp. RCC_161_2]|uniref:YadA-like family protein n=1 Tax=Rhizobium sp. RCC_161_2 TaxID=3239219 RepID=UPI00352426C1